MPFAPRNLPASHFNPQTTNNSPLAQQVSDHSRTRNMKKGSSNSWQQHQQQGNQAWSSQTTGWEHHPSYPHQNLSVPRVLNLADDDQRNTRFDGVAGSPSSAKHSTFGSDSSPLAGHSTVSSILSSSYDSSGVSASVAEATLAFNRLSVGSDEVHGRQKPPQLHVPTHPAAPTMHYSPYTHYFPRDYMDYTYPYSPVRPGAEHNAVAFPSPVPYNAAVVQQGQHPELQRSQQPGGYYVDYNASPVAANATPAALGASAAGAYYYGPGASVMYPVPTTAPLSATPVNTHRDVRARHSISSMGPVLTFAGAPLFTQHRQGGQGEYGRPLSVIEPSGPRYGDQKFSSPSHGQPMGFRRDAQQAVRSAILTEFKNNKTRKWELRDIFGYCVEFSGDQHGSRFIQQRMDNASTEERNVVFAEIVPTGHAAALMQDVFGNYVIQKLFEFGSQAQRAMLANAMKGRVLQLSLDMYGCRVVQKAVECVLPDQQASFVKELDGHILRCVKDANGNHVIQKLLERVIGERMTFVRAFSGAVYDLSTHPYGCRVLQRCFEYANKEQCRLLFDELRGVYAALAKDQFGNYVVQYVLENGPEEDRTYIVNLLSGNLLEMAKHKFASNVCEKALLVASLERRHSLITEMLAPGPDGVSAVVTMMRDQFANYVLQRALKLVEGDQFEALVSLVWPQLLSMRQNPNGFTKHLNAIERLLREKGVNLPSPDTERSPSDSTPTP